jgi:hypothetical protein
MLFRGLAKQLLLPQGAGMRRIVPNLIVVHTNGGPGSITGLRNYWQPGPNWPNGSGVFSHFQVDADGSIGQYQDTELEAPAQFDGNSRGVSIETQDNGDPDVPWTRVQALALSTLIAAVAQQHDIPLRMVVTADEHGVGYHEQFTAWNHNGHRCPGFQREQQLRNFVLPNALPSPPSDQPDVPYDGDLMNVITLDGKQPRIVNGEGKVSAVLGSGGWHFVNQLKSKGMAKIEDVDAAAYAAAVANGQFA